MMFLFRSTWTLFPSISGTTLHIEHATCCTHLMDKKRQPITTKKTISVFFQSPCMRVPLLPTADPASFPLCTRTHDCGSCNFPAILAERNCASFAVESAWSHTKQWEKLLQVGDSVENDQRFPAHRRQWKSRTIPLISPILYGMPQ